MQKPSPPSKPVPKLPQATPGACAHEHLRFQDGTFHLICIDCDQQWAAVKDGAFAFTLRSVPMYPPRDTRHDRWVLSRTQPLPKPPEKPPVKKR